MSPRHRSSADGGSGEQSASFFERLFGSQTIRGRLVRILVVSVALVIALLGITIAGELSAYTAAGQTRSAVTLALTVQDVTQELQRERGLTNGLMGGETRFAATIPPQRIKTDKALATLNQAVAATNVSGADRVKTALSRLSDLTSTRQGVDAGRADRTTTFGYYTSAIAALNQVDLGFDQAQDAQLRRGLLALGALADTKEATGQERGFLNGVFASGRFNTGEYIKFTEIRASKQAGLAAFALNTTADRQAQLDAALRSDNATKAAASENIAIAATSGPLAQSVDPVNWWNQMTSVIDQMRTVQQSVGADLEARATQLRDDATTALMIFLAIALVAVALELTLVIGALRSIVRPLASLAVEADDVAARRLPASVAGWHTSGGGAPEPPEPVRTPKRAGTEIASVAAALDRVQTTAFELAGEQALLRRNTTESLANLGRRNQNLVRRQLGFISEFEREELDPTALANLFELDHLATRMRRNAESLLVLVSETGPRRYAKPLAVTEVVRAALSEVEDYRRAALRRMDEVLITGSMVNELAHMLAELLENALAFSPPDMEVEVYGRKLGSKYMLAVVDHGVGMSREQLVKANARLHGEEDFIVAPTRFLGHYVVGQLAKRLGVEVELTVSPVNGIVARLLLPEELLATEDRTPADVPAPPVRKPVRPVRAPAAPAAPAAEQEPIQWPEADEEPVFVPRQEQTVAPRKPLPPKQQPVSAGSVPPVAAAQTPQAPQTPQAAGPVERTRNGLVKRAKRTSGEARPTPARPTTPKPPGSGAIDQRSPEDVRSMLSKFRSGHERGTSGEEETR
ncbi:MAG: sensor protein [Amycolatopsis sp.]|uniref:sensor histidine kinase n=1 Tax=Amycolatopsis sp. TaxID=37632 RepID=UPI0026271E0F|nr:nitrate- and nitrite sensing domain-containing protein [Amycolatopsis sp.]MCU1686694.1 sensor protein [Amycolatopsis sp.]